MPSWSPAALVAAGAFLCALAGFGCQKILPEGHIADRSRELIGSMVGLFSLLLALALGTLIGASYGAYATQKAQIETFATHAVQLDAALADYGPEAAAARPLLKSALQHLRDGLWSGDGGNETAIKIDYALQFTHKMNAFLAGLDAKTTAQIKAAGAIDQHLGPFVQTRIALAMQLTAPINWPLVYIVSIWACVLFFGYGILSRANATTIVALALGAIAVGSAMLLIIDLSAPFSGSFRVPPGAIDLALDALGR